MNISESFSTVFKTSQLATNLNNLSRHFYILDQKGNGLYFNDTCTDFLKCNSINLNNKINTYDLIPSKEADLIKKYNESVLKLQKEMIFEESFTYENNNTKTAISIKAPFRDFKRNLRGIIGISFIRDDSNIHYIDKQKELKPNKIECLYLIVKGYTYTEIGRALHLSPRTIEHYMNDLYDKFDCSKRYELVNHALKMNEIKFRLLME